MRSSLIRVENRGSFPPSIYRAFSARARTPSPSHSKINKGVLPQSPIQLNPITFFAATAPARIRTAGGRRCEARAERANTGGVPYRFETILEGGFTLRRFWFRLRGLRDTSLRGATLRRFELRGEPQKRAAQPRDRPSKRDNAEKAEGRGGGEGGGRGKPATRRGRIDKKGRGIERIWGSSWCLFFTLRETYTRHPMRDPRSQIQ